MKIWEERDRRKEAGAFSCVLAGGRQPAALNAAFLRLHYGEDVTSALMDEPLPDSERRSDGGCCRTCVCVCVGHETRLFSAAGQVTNMFTERASGFLSGATADGRKRAEDS